MAVTCSACQAETTVPFTPTPGRPVYCRSCFEKQAQRRAAGPARRGPGGFGARDYKPPAQPRKKMLSQGEKAHFVYDSLQVLAAADNMDEARRRGFVEMLFTRGSRQSTEAAHQFIEEKAADETISEAEAERLSRLVDRYSFRR